jgi:hypothetical protein
VKVFDVVYRSLAHALALGENYCKKQKAVLYIFLLAGLGGCDGACLGRSAHNLKRELGQERISLFESAVTH